MSSNISVIIPVYNDNTQLKRCIKSIFNTSFSDFNVVIVDDYSRVPFESPAEAYPIIIKRLDENRGQAYARNFGIKQTEAEILLFTDADCEVMEDWVKIISNELRKCHKKNNDIVAMCGKIGGGSSFFGNCHAYTGYAYVQNGKQRETNYLNTSCVAIYHKAFLEVCGFSENFRLNEDTDLGLKLIQKGYKIIFEPYIYVSHNHGINTLKSFLNKHKIWGVTGGLEFDLKYHHRLGCFRYLFTNHLALFFLIAPVAFLTTLKIVLYNFKYKKKILLYAFFIFIGKIFFRWGIFIKSRMDNE